MPLSDSFDQSLCLTAKSFWNVKSILSLDRMAFQLLVPKGVINEWLSALLAIDDGSESIVEVALSWEDVLYELAESVVRF